jgi:hypothetical protein
VGFVLGEVEVVDGDVAALFEEGEGYWGVLLALRWGGWSLGEGWVEVSWRGGCGRRGTGSATGKRSGLRGV